MFTTAALLLPLLLLLLLLLRCCCCCSCCSGSSCGMLRLLAPSLVVQLPVRTPQLNILVVLAQQLYISRVQRIMRERAARNGAGA